MILENEGRCNEKVLVGSVQRCMEMPLLSPFNSEDENRRSALSLENVLQAPKYGKMPSEELCCLPPLVKFMSMLGESHVRQNILHFVNFVSRKKKKIEREKTDK